MPGYDRRRLRELRRWVNSDGSTFDFGTWARRTDRGTLMCLAARTVVDFGAALVWEGEVPGVPPTAGKCVESGKLYDIGELATDVLLLTEEEAEVLFNPDLGTVQDSADCALAFLDFLISRAESDKGNLETGQPEGWKFCWEWTNVGPPEGE